jgi:hypothetical protein
LTFQSETTLDPLTRPMVVSSESFQLRRAGSAPAESYTTDFRMRCWSALELHERFAPRFEGVDILPNYIGRPACTDGSCLFGLLS